MIDILVVGAGPAGLCVASAAMEKGFNVTVIEKGCITNEIVKFQRSMVFRSRTRDFEIRDIPMISAGMYPTREEVLRYYHRFVRMVNLDIKLRHTVQDIVGSDNAFLVKCVDHQGYDVHLHAKKVVLATGCLAVPNPLGIPGEDLEKVSHSYFEPYLYENADVLVVGGGGSAAEVVIDLAAANAKVILSYRGTDEFPKVNSWDKAHLLDLIESETVVFYPESTLKEVKEDSVLIVMKDRGEQMVKNDFVFMMTGYGADKKFFETIGFTLDKNGMPVTFSESLETNLAGIYLSGAVAGNGELNSVAIKDHCTHASIIMKDILSKL